MNQQFRFSVNPEPVNGYFQITFSTFGLPIYISVLIRNFDNVFYVKKFFHRKDAKAAKIDSEQCTFSGGEKLHTASPAASFSTCWSGKVKYK